MVNTSALLYANHQITVACMRQVRRTNQFFSHYLRILQLKVHSHSHLVEMFELHLIRIKHVANNVITGSRTD